MTDSTYSTVDDLLIGDMPVAVSVGKQKFVNDAADEVDAIIGARYQTPLDMTEDGSLQRSVRLFIKRAANNIASGRLILALAAGGEDRALHAYGWSLVQEATEALKQIKCGDYDLEGAVPISNAGDDEQESRRGPSVRQQDPVGGLAAFYGRFGGRDPVAAIMAPRWTPYGGD